MSIIKEVLVKKRLRFTDHDDITLLREVLGQNPIEHPAVWAIIRENMLSVTKKNFSIRTLKEHLELLIKLWLKEFKTLKNLSGIEVAYTEKNNLCESIYELMCNQEKKKQVNKELHISKKVGEDIRDQFASTSKEIANRCEVQVEHVSFSLEDSDIAMRELETNGEHNYSAQYKCTDVMENGLKLPETSVQPSISNSANASIMPNNSIEAPIVPPASSSNTPTSRVLGPIRSRKRKINVQRQGLAYLEAYDQQQKENKRKEIELEQLKLELEERKIAVMERQVAVADFETRKKYELEEQRLKFEVDQRNDLIKIIERQDKLIYFVINKK